MDSSTVASNPDFGLGNRVNSYGYNAEPIWILRCPLLSWCVPVLALEQLLLINDQVSLNLVFSQEYVTISVCGTNDANGSTESLCFSVLHLSLVLSAVFWPSESQK